MTPALSVILVATTDFALVRDAVRNLARQRDSAIELVIAAPRDLEHGIDADDRAVLHGFAAYTHVVVPDDTAFDDARAAAVRAATAPIVAFTEDHSFPEPGWAAALLESFGSGYAVVGPVVENGNPRSAVSRANFLLEYGEWMPPGRRDAHDHLPGHNSAYRRELLLHRGDRLTSLLEAESVLHWELVGEGHRITQAPRARTRHVNFSRFAPSLALRYHLGRQFAARRAERWPLATRLAYAAAFPVVALVRTGRVARMAAASAERASVLTALPMVALLVLVASVGESVGYLTRRAGPSREYLSDIEHDRARFTREAVLDGQRL